MRLFSDLRTAGNTDSLGCRKIFVVVFTCKIILFQNLTGVHPVQNTSHVSGHLIDAVGINNPDTGIIGRTDRPYGVREIITVPFLQRGYDFITCLSDQVRFVFFLHRLQKIRLKYR